MNFKMILLAASAVFMMGACAHKHAGHEGCDCAQHKTAKKGCSGECETGKTCADCAAESK
ncbi:hypothetical protein [Bdellovibrio reynosensis]|uniref:Uncharacterized protein n=1 Tax=Bdellovibrio reynosensis TaxID=2835041 RepID=A0ABY4CB20_9BACT|nr:hypothetical protein [Bdellovibrio reynosensis]UOF02167.1 hypothetical protein MNR06_04260 [Bdellovibrio reynosensis]